MDLRNFGIDRSFVSVSALQDLMDSTDVHEKPSQNNNPSKAYIRDTKAMAATAADVREDPNSYVFIVDMPGIAAGDIKVQLEDDNVLVVSGERKREREEEVKYLRMERRLGKFMRKFSLPENANTHAISAVYRDGVLVVTVEKLPPKKPKTVVVKVGN